MLAKLPLQELRHVLELTQQQLADELNMNQASLSKLEKRTDMLLSTLRRYLNAMGTDLELKTEFPDGNEVIITQLKGLQKISTINHVFNISFSKCGHSTSRTSTIDLLISEFLIYPV